MFPTQTVRFIRDADGARVAYAIVGEGPLILCPAWWVSHVERDWEHPGFRHFFARLAEGFRVVRYDRPGSGLSDRDVAPRTQVSEVQLLGALADALGDSQFSMFAVSCGGPAALTYAAAHPDRIRRLCLYGSFTSGSDAVLPEVGDAPCRSCDGPLGLRVYGAISDILQEILMFIHGVLRRAMNVS
jgi:pimeloyl-ACP methyl ester carboxylesterase